MPIPHVTPPTSRLAHESILLQLRDVDPAAELLYLGQGHWALGRCRPTPERRDAADKMLAAAWQSAREGAFEEASWYRRLRFARAVREGFAQMESYHPPDCDCPNVTAHTRLDRGEPDARIVRDFTRAIYRWRRDLYGRDFERRMRHEEADRKARARAEYGDMSRARDAERWLRHPVSIVKPRAASPTPTPRVA